MRTFYFIKTEYGKRITIVQMLLLFIVPSFCQKYNSARIENVSLNFNGEDVEITYDINNARQDAVFAVNLEFCKDPGQLLSVYSVTGDIGASVKGGAGKIIIWKSRKDGYIIDDDVYVKIKATTNAYIPIGNYITKSLFVPGWGDYKICNGNYHFLYGVAAYGSLGASIVYYSLANTNRKNYLNSMEIDKRNNFYNTYTNQKTLSYVFAATAAAIWVYDIVKVAVKTSRLKKSVTPQSSKYYYDLSLKEIAGTSKVQYLNTKTPYDFAITEAKNLFDNKDYIASRNSYMKAKELSPEESLPKEKIAEIDQILAEIKALNDKYNAAITKGNSFLSSAKYDDAKNSFNTALAIKPDATYPEEKISYIDGKLKEIALEKEYNDNIVSGDKSLSEKNYETAINYYEIALKLKPNAAYPNEKLLIIEKIQDQIKQKKNDKDFIILVKKGDEAYRNGDYLAAMNYYEAASVLKPNDMYVAEMSDKAYAIIHKNAQANKEKNEKIKELENNKKYTEAIINGDEAYDNKEYDKAKNYYQNASNIKPTESYPKSKIQQINKIIENAKTQAETNQTQDLPMLYKQCKQSVFFVFTSNNSENYQGYGFFITSSGVGISNYHVFKGTYQNSARVYTEDGTEYEIETILIKNEDLDYIIFKVKNPYGVKFSKVKIASKTPAIGESVFAIGNPKGFEKTLSTGIISGIRGDKDQYLQTTTPISHGSSGGPLFNNKGEVIGITTLGILEDNLFFCMDIQKIPYGVYLSY